MILSLDDIGYVYPSGTRAAVADVSLSVVAGERVLVTGPTGCGKSTLLRLCTGLLQRHGTGRVIGQALLRGVPPDQMGPAERVAAMGWVAQDPVAQVVTGTVGDELAFPLEVQELDAAEMERRSLEALALVGLDLALDRPTDALSGGQRQRLSLAAALVGGARLLLLDEPLAQVDPVAARQLVAVLDEVASRGVAIVMVEHRLELLWRWADSLLLLADGEVVYGGPARQAPIDTMRRLGLTLPGTVELASILGQPLDTVPRTPVPPVPSPRVLAETPVLEAGPIDWRWPDAETPALRGVSVKVRRGERIAILGSNGSGKSTLLSCLAGTLDGGPVRLDGSLVDVPQDPDLALFCETVREELSHGPHEARLPWKQVLARREETAAALSLEPLLERAPQALSRGQRLRTAVGAALACHPRLLLLDEPTAGQDHDQVERMMHALADRPDLAVVFATHDVSLALRHADRWWVLRDGELVVDAPPEEALTALDSLPLPELARWCQERGWPTLDARTLAGWLMGVR